MIKLNWVRKIYDDGMHCAFTDMVRWNGWYYVAFRRAQSHGIVPSGDVFVIRSRDLERWDVCGMLTTGLDDRDPALVVDGERLWIYFYSRFVETTFVDGNLHRLEGGAGHSRTWASCTLDGVTWRVPTPVYEPNVWLWHPQRFDDGFYCAAYETKADRASRELMLLRSDDAINWRKLSTIRNNNGGEAFIVRDDDGRFMVVNRGSMNEARTDFFHASPPYAQWSGWRVNHAMQSPNVVHAAGRLIAAGRRSTTDPPDWYKTVTTIFEIDPKTQTTRVLLDLPSGGDTSYCGMVVDDDGAILVSYYSQHEYLDLPDFRHGFRPASIYLAKLTVPMGSASKRA
jgi:hypothetical protein